MTPAPGTMPHIGLAAATAPARRSRRVVIRLWLPLTLLFLLLAPFAILAIPLLYLVPQIRPIKPAVAVFRLGAALLALSGADVLVDTSNALVRIKIV